MSWQRLESSPKYSCIILETDLNFSGIDRHDRQGSTINCVDRKAVRTVLFNHEGQIALIHVAAHNYYKLPGGGIDGTESHEQALKREIHEEVGCDAKIQQLIGSVIEYRQSFGQKQTSHCYTARVIEGGVGEQNFTDLERSQNFRLLWVTWQEALQLITEACPDNYEGLFIQARDAYLLKQALAPK